jgi:EpsI family protein
MSSRTLWIKTAGMALLLISTALLLGKRGDQEVVVPHQPLAQFPEALGTAWNGRSVGIDPGVIEILGAGDFAERSFRRDDGSAPVDLFLAYFPSQRTGVSIHSPKNCLPGSGWGPVESKYVRLSGPHGREYAINEYVVQKGEQKQLVLYWYQAHGRLVASEYAAKFYLVTDAMRMNRSDGALVRIVTPIVGGESSSQAEQRAMQFAGALMPNLQRYIPA